MALDRVSTERKDPEWVRARLADPAARTVAASGHGVLLSVDGDGTPTHVLRTEPDDRDDAEAILLGVDQQGAPLFALDLEGRPDAPDPEHLSGGRIVSLRDAGSILPPSEAGLAAYLVGMLNWHRRHHFCANCGAPTAIVEGGHARHCPVCKSHHFPRTDPVVIVTVEHAGRLLLGRRTGWPAGRLSVLAGFVSPGESAEEAVVREVQEESGIVSRDPVYVASQPWPFPASLMLGFHATSEGGRPQPRDGELEEVRWLTRDEVRGALAGQNPDFLLPPSVSIARYLIERWAMGAAPEPGGKRC